MRLALSAYLHTLTSIHRWIWALQTESLLDARGTAMDAMDISWWYKHSNYIWGQCQCWYSYQLFREKQNLWIIGRILTIARPQSINQMCNLHTHNSTVPLCKCILLLLCISCYTSCPQTPLFILIRDRRKFICLRIDILKIKLILQHWTNIYKVCLSKTPDFIL